MKVEFLNTTQKAKKIKKKFRHRWKEGRASPFEHQPWTTRVAETSLFFSFYRCLCVSVRAWVCGSPWGILNRGKNVYRADIKHGRKEGKGQQGKGRRKAWWVLGSFPSPLVPLFYQGVLVLRFIHGIVSPSTYALFSFTGCVLRVDLTFLCSSSSSARPAPASPPHSGVTWSSICSG